MQLAIFCVNSVRKGRNVSDRAKALYSPPFPSRGFFGFVRCLLESVSALRRTLFSVAVGLLSLSLGGICFRFFVPLTFLLCLCRLRTLFCNCARLNFAFQIVNPLSLSFVFSTLRWRQTSEDFILPSLALLCAELLQFGLVLFPCHDGSSLGGDQANSNVN